MSVSKKQALRAIMKEKREVLFQKHPEAGEKIAALFFNFFDLPPHIIIGAYWPIGSELDIRPLLNKLIDRGFACALPCIEQEGLLFRLWNPSLRLVKGKFYLWEPPVSCSTAIPDVLLVPLLAFDKTGHRLGYGQGHYDRYLHHHKPLTLGVGFKGQEVEKIAHQSHDVPLDFIVTEEEVRASKKSVESNLDY
ncbi:MAG: 5-formyltetrahydrofolate cyclo-ligase [Proteobacteria bacterium]|nr:5-formyltetrahydrofolate cyclo-ligase [Pseudomonadota bacterium]